MRLRGAGLLGLLLTSFVIASCGGGGKSASTRTTGVAVAGGPAGVSTAAESAAGTTSTSGAQSKPGTQSSPSVQPAARSGRQVKEAAAVGNSGGAGRSPSPIAHAHTHHSSGKAVGGSRKSSHPAAPSGSTGSGSGESTSVPAAGESSYEVTSLNMEPTYPPRTTVTYSPTRTSPIVGDVVVFHLPLNALERGCGENPPPFHACQDSASGLSGTLAIGRVLGVAGDSLAFKEGNAILNGVLQHESSTKPCGEGPVCSFSQPIVVPAGSYYILYDNRAMLDDSRVWGAVPQTAILGTVTGTQ